jgi:hypothetical protein
MRYPQRNVDGGSGEQVFGIEYVTSMGGDDRESGRRQVKRDRLSMSFVVLTVRFSTVMYTTSISSKREASYLGT